LRFLRGSATLTRSHWGFSISPGKTADIILVDGDEGHSHLRHVDTVFLDGYRLSGQQLRQASGLNGMPK
jgi:hypothetical protein